MTSGENPQLKIPTNASPFRMTTMTLIAVEFITISEMNINILVYVCPYFVQTSSFSDFILDVMLTVMCSIAPCVYLLGLHFSDFLQDVVQCILFSLLYLVTQ